LVRARLLLVLDHLLLPKSWPSYPRYSWSFCAVCGRTGDTRVFRLSMARRMT
jgi:hypothetical protein